MPFEFDRPDVTHRLSRAEVTSALGACSMVKILDQKEVIPQGGAHAFLETQVLYQWPVGFPDGDGVIYDLLQKSKYLRPSSLNDNELLLLRVSQSASNLQMIHRAGTLLSTQPDVGHFTAGEIIVKRAETFARGQNLFTLQTVRRYVMLEHSLRVHAIDVDAGLFLRGLSKAGSAEIWDGERIHVSLGPDKSHPVHIAIFEVSPAVNVTPITSQDDTRIKGRESQAGKYPVPRD
ncbi:Caspase domain [Fusarium albosuccineum]|uniref:Caspase domain n=1 Tax=Fusarium albosuccineum TaxID=1237068 RepID=A0A8H4P7V2_9HYPO|nr:Caspase domain [Fusarium albosuccineum]